MTSGLVSVAGERARKVSQPVTAETALAVDPDAPRWVGRAAHKLLAALDLWGGDGLDPAGRRCLDVGASTGGFTQVLLAAGAAHVVALDVGHDQLVAELREDPRVEDRSGTTVRGVTAADLGCPFDVVVGDLSFISLTLVAAELAGLLAADGDLVVLVKPQFEVGRSKLSGAGLVLDPRDRARAVTGVLEACAREGLHPHGLARSPITGSTGNAEYLLWARSVPSDRMDEHRLGTLVRALATDETGG